MADTASSLDSRNRRMAYWVLAVVVSMVALAYAAVPLYNLFCRVTGYGGTTQVAQSAALGDISSSAADGVLMREIKIRFNAANHRDMPWIFRPKEAGMSLKVGERAMAYYEAYNPTDHAITGTATYNVTPHKAGPYFVKIECFCFTEQTLEPGERVDMPVLYYIDPDIVKDSDLDRVHEITLSYTFFIKEEGQGTVSSGR